MKGSYHIIVQNRYLKYEFDIGRNLTIIQGDSATGKTTLVDMIRESGLNSESGITISSKCPLVVVEGSFWKEQISYIASSIVFIDEGSSFVETEDFARIIRKSSNYYVIVTRENLDMLPVSVEEVYGIKSSGKYGTLEKVYHEMYRLYDLVEEPKDISFKPSEILVEDSGSGYDFFKDVAEQKGLKCRSAHGRANIFNILSSSKSGSEILVIADGAAFASQMNRICSLMKQNRKIHLYLPESFEWLLLDCGIIKDAVLPDILQKPSDYIESSSYFSWERFFSSLIVKVTKGTYLQYSKTKLNSNYLEENIQKRILSAMEGIEL